MKTINVLIGTKAQYIKVAPVILNLSRAGLPYRLVDLCQHKDITEHLRRIFGIREPDARLETGFDNINTPARAFRWALRVVWLSLFRKRYLREALFEGSSGGICLVHGDTLSTLLGCMIARAAGQTVGHLEAGLRSFDLTNPFPEELIRIACMHKADYLFAPSEWARKNAEHMRVRGRIMQVSGNTVFDTIKIIASKEKLPEPELPGPFALISIHRFENIFSRGRLSLLVAATRTIAEKMDVLFVLHQPTVKRLSRYGLMNSLKHPRIHIEPLREYPSFLGGIKHAEFVITDGGSIQEECYFLDRPCVLFRSKTERRYGLGQNVCLSSFDPAVITHFIENYTRFKRTDRAPDGNPSSEVTALLSEIVKN